ncbi:MAG: hypothetical protein ACRDQU_00855 [Pseudonocardiaceae bacterium]
MTTTIPGFPVPNPEFPAVRPWVDAPPGTHTQTLQVHYATAPSATGTADSDAGLGPAVQGDIDSIVSRAQDSTLSAF